MRNLQREQDTGLYFISVFSAVLGLILLLFVIVMIPYVFFNAVNTVPDFVIALSRWLEDNNALEGFWQRMLIMSPLLVSSGLFFLISWWTTGKLEAKDKELFALHQKALAEAKGEAAIELEANQVKGDFVERHPALLIFALILLLLGSLVLVEYLIGADIL